MRRLKDEIHNCYKCELYPCSLQEEVSRRDICKDCPVPCCRSVLMALMPCEEVKLELGKYGGLKMKDNGWCYYFDKDKGGCSIYEKRPIGCRIASCRFIREGKIPEEIKVIKKEMQMEEDEKELTFKPSY